MSDPPADEWTKEDSREVAEATLPIVQLVLSMDRERVARAVEELEKYETAGPLLDPTGWMSGGRETSEKAKARLEALLECYDALEEVGDV